MPKFILKTVMATEEFWVVEADSIEEAKEKSFYDVYDVEENVGAREDNYIGAAYTPESFKQNDPEMFDIYNDELKNWHLRD